MRLVMFGVLAMLGACATPKEAPVPWGTLDGKAPLIIAHRGASGYLPEHTLEAYALAVDQGADVIEPDLVFTKDGVLVARHDRYLSTTTNVAGKPEFACRKRANNDPNDDPREDWWVEDFTLAEIKTLRARQPFPGRSKEHDDKFEIPTFEEMLALVARKSKEAGRPVGVYPETKHPAFFASIGHDFEAPLLKALEGFDAGPVFIQSFEPEILKRLKGKTDAKLVQLVFEERPGAGANIPLEEIATYADGVGPSKNLIIGESSNRSSFIVEAHRHGLTVHAWTFRTDQPNEKMGFRVEFSKLEAENPLDWEATDLPRDMLALRDKYAEAEVRFYLLEGADGLFADFPDTAAKVRAKVTLPER
ncbi:MAG: glycerophosphodiester phosphodiesterase family protein [Parvularculaceae bacterium]